MSSSNSFLYLTLENIFPTTAWGTTSAPRKNQIHQNIKVLFSSKFNKCTLNLTVGAPWTLKGWEPLPRKFDKVSYDVMMDWLSSFLMKLETVES